MGIRIYKETFIFRMKITLQSVITRFLLSKKLLKITVLGAGK